MGPVPVSLNAGNAQFTISQPAVGSHMVSIQYAAEGNFAASQVSNQTFTVTLAPILENITASSYWAQQATAITISVALNSWSAGAPHQGDVSFYDNGVLLGTVSVGSKGTASFTTSNLTVGQHSIQASYSGTSQQYASSTNSLTLTLAQ